MIIIRRRNKFSKNIFDSGKFMLFSKAINYLKNFSDSNSALIEIKLIDTLSEHVNDKSCFQTYDEAIKFLKEKNGED